MALSVFTLLCNPPHHPSLGFIFPNWKSESTEWEFCVLSLSWPFCWTQPLLLACLSWPLESPVDSHEMIAFILSTSVLSFLPSPRSAIFSLLLTSVLVHMLCLVAQLCPTLCSPMGCSLPGSSVHGDFPGKNTGVGCHAPHPPRDLPNPGIELGSPALQVDSLPAEPPGKPIHQSNLCLWGNEDF